MTNLLKKATITGIGWSGSGFESIGSVLEQLVANSKNEILIGAYYIGSVNEDFFLNQIKRALERGVRLVMLINRYNEQPEYARRNIDRLRFAHLNVEIYSVECPEGEDFHAKLMVVDRNKAIIGSANLSWRGLACNYELGVYVEGRTADEAARALERLIANGIAKKI